MIATCCGAWYFTQLIPPDALPLKNHPVQNVTFKLETQTHWTVQNKNATINDSNHVNINKHLKKHHTLQSWDSLEPSGMIYGKHSKNQRTPPHQWPQSQESAIICHSFWKKQTTHGESGVCSHVALNIFESIGHWNGSCHGSFRHETYESRWAVLQDEVSQPSASRETRSRYSGCKPASFPDPNEVPQNGTVLWCFFWLKYHEFVHFKSPNYRHVACRNQARTTIVHIWWLACVEIGMDHQTVSPSPLFKHC